MIPHPESPRALCDQLGLRIDLDKAGSPAIVGPTGKRHYYSHGRPSGGGREMCDVLHRLVRLRAAVPCLHSWEPDGTRPVDPDDLLRAMLESSRWQKYDL